MRHGAVALVLLGTAAFGTPSAVALDKPSGAGPIVVPVADLDDASRGSFGSHRRADTYWHWRYRAAYVRWLHTEYVRSGYPVRHPSRRVYPRW